MKNEKRAILIALVMVLLLTTTLPAAVSAEIHPNTRAAEWCRVGYTMYPVFGVSYQFAVDLAANFELENDPCPPRVAKALLGGYKIQIRRLR